MRPLSILPLCFALSFLGVNAEAVIIDTRDKYPNEAVAAFVATVMLTMQEHEGALARMIAAPDAMQTGNLRTTVQHLFGDFFADDDDTIAAPLLYWLTMEEWPEERKLLINILRLCGVDINRPLTLMEDGARIQLTAMHLAATTSEDVLRDFIAAGGDVNARGTQQVTPLMVAAGDDQPDGVCFLLGYYATNFCALDENGRNVLHVAAERGTANVARILLQRGRFLLMPREPQCTLGAHRAYVNLCATDKDGRTALHYAVERADGDRDKNTMSYVLLNEFRQDYAHRNVAGAFLAAREHDLEIFVNMRDSEGQTALHLAVLNNRVRAIRILLANGARPRLADNAGRTPLGIAEDMQRRGVLDEAVMRALMGIPAPAIENVRSRHRHELEGRSRRLRHNVAPPLPQAAPPASFLLSAIVDDNATTTRSLAVDVPTAPILEDPIEALRAQIQPLIHPMRYTTASGI